MPATKEYWPLVLENIKNKVSDSSFKAWFSRLEFVNTGNHGRKIIIGVPSAFNKKYIENKFKSELREAISKYYPQVVHIDYKVNQTSEITQFDHPQEPLIDQPNQSQPTQPEPTLSSYLPSKSLSNLNPKYTFENFVVTKNNELAVSVCKSIVEQPGTMYNPIFIHGSVGLGKTHLIQAIGQKMLEAHPSFNIKYITSETFVNQFILAFQKRKMDEFREYYRSVDLLLIDDIQFIASKEATQEVFFHTFNELHQLNKQIIITSDRTPKNLAGIEDRLISRFEWGMVVDIIKPDLESRMAILKDKSERMGLILSDSQCSMIAESIDSNIRELEGVLNKLKAKLQISTNTELSDQEVASLLSISQSESPIKITLDVSTQTPDRILQAVCKLFSITKADVLGTSRQKNIALARQITMWFYKYELDLSYPTIGKLFSGRDHTTAMHGCNKVNKLIDSDPKIAAKIQTVKDLLLHM
jgi:chromosomal replication initiator protein